MPSEKVSQNLRNDRDYYYSRLKVAGKIIYHSGAARFYYDGDGLGFVWNWWHPLTWFMAPILLMIHVVLEGVIEAWKYKHDLGIGMKPWFKENPERLEWMK